MVLDYPIASIIIDIVTHKFKTNPVSLISIRLSKFVSNKLTKQLRIQFDLTSKWSLLNRILDIFFLDLLKARNAISEVLRRHETLRAWSTDLAALDH